VLARLDEGAVDRLLEALQWHGPGGRTLPLSEVAVQPLTDFFSARYFREDKVAKLTKFAQRAIGTGLPPVDEPANPAASPLASPPAKRARRVRTVAPPPPPPLPPGWGGDSILGTLGRLGRLPVPNVLKEPYWLLAYNGINVPSRCPPPKPTAGQDAAVLRPTPQRPTTCLCGAPGTLDLRHAFWECPVAQEIRLLLERPLWACGLLPGGVRLPRWSLWLIKRPGPIAAWVWDIMALVAIYAMEEGRRDLARAAGEASTEARTRAACSRARLAFWRGVGLVTGTITLNDALARQLAASGAALQGRFPYLRASPSDPSRVVPGLFRGGV